MRFRLLVALVALLAVVGLMPASALPAALSTSSEEQSSLALREDADWSEHYFFAGDGITRLHADVLRPKGMAWDAAEPVQTPVILTATPYGNHNGSTTDLDLNGVGPNPRFYDFLNLTKAMENGYTFVMVDLPGTGGSGGCNDWGGNREQAAVRAAVEWAASQPWSNGRVGLLGKSYDGWTGLMGIAQAPDGLEAVVSLEPVYSGYRYVWMNGVRRPNNPATLALFQAIDAKPGRPGDTPEYQANSAPIVWCYGVNIAGSFADDYEHGPYWDERDLLDRTLGRTTPLFLTQGFLETNTHSDGAFQYWNGLAGSENHAWFGQFDHCRGWETGGVCGYGGGGDRLAFGRPGFIEEVMRFFDEHLKGIEPEVTDPTVTVQDIEGRYRAEASWPPADMQVYETDLRLGTYTDSGSGNGMRPSAAQGIWTISEPLAHDVWLAGEPFLTVGVDAVPNANIAANVYDIDPDGVARMISRGVSILRGTGTRTTSYSMYGQDWPIRAGHRVGVLVSSADNIFTHVPTRTTVTLLSAKIGLPFLTYDRTEFIDADASTPRLEQYLNQTGAVLPEATILGAEQPFTLPGPLAEAP